MESKKKILLIDDDKDFLMATKLILEKGGYEVFLAEDGKSGLEMARKVSPDLAIIDMMMETWSEGFNVVSRLRTSETGKQIPLIMLSAVDLQGPYQSFEPPENLPTVDLVQHKPIKADELLGHISTLLKKQ
ncbi:MAG TPA: response regulator [Deltaproteobacteria bacterium]|nr:response regulator [Deltaproteobacteria bacterium]HPP79790.1 response regulator [Deltaproteobacteria bacterium]